MHRWLGHGRLGGVFFRNHIRFHHAFYAKDHLVSANYRGEEGNNTPYFLIPTALFWCSILRASGRLPDPRRLFLGAGAVLVAVAN
jgi:hypothetical protein